MTTFDEITPIMIVLTLIISTFIIYKVRKTDIFTVDGTFAVIGILLGLSISFLNLIYSNSYIFSLGPVITISCAVYLRYRAMLLANELNLICNNRQLIKFNQIIYWLFIFLAIYIFHQSELYYRPPLFFICICICSISLSLEILFSYINKHRAAFIVCKIFLISSILRGSAWFISPYPVGHDSWAHYEYIKNFMHLGHLIVESYPPGTGMDNYYTNYPMAHLVVCSLRLLSDLSIKESMFSISLILIFSSIFVYFIAKIILNNENLALLSVLLLNISDHHITWGVIIVAMSFGIAIYSLLLYLIINTRYENNSRAPINKMFLILCVFLLVYTHTIASFIFIMVTVSLYFNNFTYYRFRYATYNKRENLVNASLIFFSIVIILAHWTSPNQTFFDSVIIGLDRSFSSDTQLFGSSKTSSIEANVHTLFNILGFLIYVFFGIIGSLAYLSNNRISGIIFAIIFTNIFLFFIMFVFPLFGMTNIVSFRWPAYIYITFVLFVSVGIGYTLNSIKSNKSRLIVLSLLMFISSFFMITSFYTNTDSPIYAEETTLKLLWTESEMCMFRNINESYGGTIVSDLQTEIRPFRTYLQRENCVSYRLTPNGEIDWEYMKNKLIIWRGSSQTRPVQIGGKGKPTYLLGEQFKRIVELDYSKIYDVGESKAYIR